MSELLVDLRDRVAKARADRGLPQLPPPGNIPLRYVDDDCEPVEEHVTDADADHAADRYADQFWSRS